MSWQCWTGLIRLRQKNPFGLKYLGLAPQGHQEMSGGHVRISSCVTFANVETLWSVAENIQRFHSPTAVAGLAALLLGCNSADIPFTSRQDSQPRHIRSYNLSVTWHGMYKCTFTAHTNLNVTVFCGNVNCRLSFLTSGLQNSRREAPERGPRQAVCLNTST